MKLFSHLSIIRGVGYLLVFILCVNCKKDYDSTNPSQLSSESVSSLASSSIVSQIRTANLFNNFNGFDDPYLNLWVQNEPVLVSADDNIFAYSNTLSAKRWYLSVSLKDFRFTIPAEATIENIIVSVRRFKKGKGSIKDYFATLNMVSTQSPGLNNPYGVRWVDPNNYPIIETGVIYSQSGTGTNGGLQGNQAYKWTPEKINNQAFGVRIDTNAPINGSVQVYYDLVEIAVEYSLPEVTPL